MKRVLILITLLITLSSSAVVAQGKSPDKAKKPEQKSSGSSLKGDANAALDDLERGLKKGGKAAKDTANEALNALDRGIHQAIDSKK